MLFGMRNYHGSVTIYKALHGIIYRCRNGKYEIVPESGSHRTGEHLRRCIYDVSFMGTTINL